MLIIFLAAFPMKQQAGRRLQERLLAALGLCSCDSAGLSQLGAPALLQAFHDNIFSASKPTGTHITRPLSYSSHHLQCCLADE